jgi:DsbC/DsbD-like thiol-disulfide interchange protein
MKSQAWVLMTAATLVAAAPLRAADEKPSADELVQTKLVADVERIAPGRPFHVGVHMDIAEGWHVYWKHPGEAGMPTEVQLTAPEGFEVGPLRWPEPATFTQPGEITGYGYAGEVLLIAEVTPPEDLDASEVEISAEVGFLACKEDCIPGEAQPALSLAVGGEAEPANESLFAKWTQKLDPMAPDFTLSDQEGNEVTLSDLRGKTVVLEWFNPDCPFTKRHHGTRTTMKDLYEKYRDEGVVWLAVNSTHYMTAEKSREWHEKWEMAFPVLVDRDGEVGKQYDAKTTPHMIVLNEAGEIVYNGAIDDDARGREEDPTNYVDVVLADLTEGRPVGQADTRPYGCSVKYAK